MLKLFPPLSTDKTKTVRMTGSHSSPAPESRHPSLYRGVHGLEEEYDLIVVGAGLSGAVIAERASSQLGLTSLVIDKRDHIGGNCYDYIDQHGIRVSLYGVHIFHTKYPRVEEYVKKFSKWTPYYHRVVGRVKVSREWSEPTVLEMIFRT